MLPSSAFLQAGQGSFLVPTWSSKVHKLLFCVCREHILGIVTLLSSLGRTWGSRHHYYCLGTCLILLSHGC